MTLARDAAPRRAWPWALLVSLGAHGLFVGVALRGENPRPAAVAPATPAPFTVTRVSLALGGRQASQGPGAASPAAEAGTPTGADDAARRVAPRRAGEPSPPEAEAASERAVAARAPTSTDDAPQDSASRASDDPSAPTSTGDGQGALDGAPVAVSPGDAPRGAEGEPTTASATTGDGPRGGEGRSAGAGRSAPGGAPSSAGDGACAAGPGGCGAPGSELVGLVHARLAAAASRCYPQAARRFSLSGTAQVSFCTGDDGATRDATLRASSGAALLDHAATGCVVAAASPLPREAASRCFTVPVHFSAR